jgi:hypothetical protein
MEKKHEKAAVLVADAGRGVFVPSSNPRLGHDSGVSLILECADFDVAVDAIERVDRAFNGQLDEPSYSTDRRAFMVTVKRVTQ